MQPQSRADRLRLALQPVDRPDTTPAVLLDDPTAWQPAFRQWIAGHCVFRDGCAGGIMCLHLHFAEWCIRHSDVCPSTRLTFESLLRREGFEVAGGLVLGLILKADAGIARRPG